MKIGKYELLPIETGTFGLDGGAMFGIIPKPLWEMSNHSDEMNRVKLNARCLLLNSPSRKILIDSGIGGDWDEKFSRIYALDQTINTLEKSLQNYGIRPEDITDVILTHLHFDHTGGSTRLENGKWVPAFSNAKYHVQKEHFKWASNPSDRDRGSFNYNRFTPLKDHGVLNFTTGNQEFDDEIQFHVINGHTFSQQMVKIFDTSNTVLYCGDLFPFTSHIPIPYVMGYDLQPLITVEEKKKYLKLAIENEWKLFFEHDPVSIAASVHKTEKGIGIKEKFVSL